MKDEVQLRRAEGRDWERTDDKLRKKEGQKETHEGRKKVKEKWGGRREDTKSGKGMGEESGDKSHEDRGKEK